MLLAVVLLHPAIVAAHGALAVGMPTSVERDGFAYGVTWDYTEATAASERAMQRCREEDVAAKAHCRVLKIFRHECVSVSMDPAPGTPGVGWAFGKTKEEASALAMKLCQQTAGESRRAYCEVSDAVCDTRP